MAKPRYPSRSIELKATPIWRKRVTIQEKETKALLIRVKKGEEIP